MLQLPSTAQSRRNRSRLVGSVAGLAAFLALTGKAQARSNEDAGDALVALDDLPNVASVELRDDGSVLIRFQDGSTRILTAGEVIVENGVVYLDPAAQAEMAIEGGSDLLLVGLGVAAVAGAVALASDGGDEEPPASGEHGPHHHLGRCHQRR